MAMTNQLINFGTMASGDFDKASVFASSARPHLIGRSTQTIADASESALVERAMSGDREAFYELVRPSERMIFSAAYSILKNEEDAEDVAQDAILKALVHLGSFRGDSKFGTWLVQIVINESRMRLRKRNRRYFESIDAEPSEDSERAPMEIADAKPLPSQEAETNELRTRLEKAIMDLSPIYREVFVLRDVNQLSIIETAKALGISEASVKTRLLRARLKMREAFADYETK
jgi:RNA polymerase sigma-70 factor, ECF subfamily